MINDHIYIYIYIYKVHDNMIYIYVCIYILWNKLLPYIKLETRKEQREVESSYGEAKLWWFDRKIARGKGWVWENYFFSHLKNMVSPNNHSLYKYHEIATQVAHHTRPWQVAHFPAKNSLGRLFFFNWICWFFVLALKLIHLFTLYFLVLYISF